MVHQEKLQGLMRAKTISLCDERQGSLVKRLRLRKYQHIHGLGTMDAIFADIVLLSKNYNNVLMC